MNKIFTEDLSKTFITDGIKNSVLRDINFSISQGETCSIIGASGCGKSTFLHLLAKLDDYSSGRIFFNEINYSDLNSDSSASLRLDNFGFVYQFHHLLGCGNYHTLQSSKGSLDGTVIIERIQ